MTIEILFPEIAGLYGDAQNGNYLKMCLKDAKFIETPFTAQPYFVNNTPDMILIGSMSEETQRKTIEKFAPYKKRIEELIDGGCVILSTGNSCEIFCSEIDYVTEKKKVSALGIFPFTVKTDLFKRYNGKVLGEFQGIDIVGFRSQFSFIYGDNSENYFLKMKRGDGINTESKFEGFKRNNFLATTCLGPILVLNPLFTEYLISLMGATPEISYREEAVSAYEKRLEEFKNPKTKF